ncbi:CPSF7 factor, partial [Brachypteracias leptosomus]|nr:CPSF7 factor [Brachypteracias leptosomus]
PAPGVPPLVEVLTVSPPQDSEFSNADQMDLYDDVLAASSQPPEPRSSSSEPPQEMRQEPPPKPNSKPPAILYTYSGLRNKRAAVYVGSFSWWTTDQQLIQTIRSVGVYDVVELKFAENRANGQSKGYAEVVVASENSVHKLLELLPGKILNGDKVEVRLATRQNLSQFEAQARKRDCGPCRCHARKAHGRGMVVTSPRPSCPQGSAAWQHQVLLDRGPSCFTVVPSLLPHPPESPDPKVFALSKVKLVSTLAGSTSTSMVLGLVAIVGELWLPQGSVLPPTSPCLFSKPLWTHPIPLLEGRGSFPSSSSTLGPPPPPVSEGEFEEIMNRNRAISSSAISKAVSGASAGDYSDAIETLLTAIAVIKQSRVANDERCRVLLSSLKDCLHGIEAKSYSTGASSSSSRKRHRSRERSPSRSRESSRRHRDLLHGDERHDDYFQERNRDHERHRDRDRERDR